MKRFIIIAVAIVVVLGLGIFLFVQDAKHPQSSDPFANKTSREIALMCAPQEYLVLHIHPVLSIFIDGQQQIIPANVGIEGLGNGDTTHQQAVSSASCLHPIHTHDASGTIHVESPVEMEFHLSDFFAVWGKTFTKDQILDSKVDSTHRIRMTINGKESTDYENAVLHDQDNIQIYYEKI